MNRQKVIGKVGKFNIGFRPERLTSHAGVVLLHDFAQRLAGVLACRVPGSRDVINGLDVVPPEEDNEDELTDAVGLVLEKDPFVNAGQIRVHTKNAVVTLEGLVATEREKAMAESDAWYVFGVDQVINALVVQA